MLDETQIVSALAARQIVPDATQRDAIAALVTLLGANDNGHRLKTDAARAHQACIAMGCLAGAKAWWSIRCSSWRAAANGACTFTSFYAR